MSIDIDEIVIFCKFLNDTIKNEGSTIQIGSIGFKEILYYCLYMNGTSCSYSLVNIHMEMNEIIDVSDTILKNCRNKVSFAYFKRINDELLNFIYATINEPRIIGVDGTSIPLSIKLKEYGYRATISNTYCTALVSSLYDINNKILINYKLCKKMDEREALKKQSAYLKVGDILVMDRGYYSDELLYFLTNKSVDVIFRMKNNSLMVQ